jgi:hypothetical protein
MRWVATAGLAFAAVLATAAVAAPPPSYMVTFSGSGSEHQLNNLKNIQDSGVCDSAEHIDVTATMTWTASWTAFRPGRRPGAAPLKRGGSTIQGSDVKDACGLDLSQAPPGWVNQTSCSSSLVAAGGPSLALARMTPELLVLAVAAAPVAVPVGVGCGLNVRNDQFTAHVSVPRKKLNALKKRGSLTFAVGTAHPGPGDSYSPTLDCSQPTKPYEGYRTADECQDTLSWSGTIKITRAS